MAKKKVLKAPSLTIAEKNTLRRIMKKVRAIGAVKRSEAAQAKRAAGSKA